MLSAHSICALSLGGVPGIGKTQLGYGAFNSSRLNWVLLLALKYILTYRIQLAVNVQIPVYYGGLGGKAIYIGNAYNL